MDYTTLSLAGVTAGLDAMARDTHETFSGLDARQLNWRPDAAQWSAAQCFEHLLAANRLMLQSAESAMTQSGPRSIWQRMPVLPGMWGRLLVRSQAPGGTRKYTAPSPARPAMSDIDAAIIQRVVEQHRQAAAWAHTLNQDEAARAVMTSPFARFITYSVLDGLRLVVAHDRRHFEQARRTLEANR